MAVDLVCLSLGVRSKMGGSVLVAALGVTALILLILFYYLSSENSKSRYPLQVIFFAFLLGVILLLGKTTIDYEDNCSWLVDNSTVVGNVTSYEHSYQCSENTNSTANTFYNITLWVIRLVSAYLLLAFAWEAITYFGWMKRGGKQREGENS